MVQRGGPPQRVAGGAPAAPQPTITVDLNRTNNNGSNTKKEDKKSKGKDGKKKLTKADIGTPSNFVYVLF